MDLDRQLKRLEDKLWRISREAVPKAHASAINKIANQGRTATASLVAREVRIKVASVKKRIYIKRATRANGVARVWLGASPVNAVETNPARLRGGWRVAGELKRNSFLAKMPNQNRHYIFQRRTRRRLPIDLVRVPIGEQVSRVGMAVFELKLKKDYPRILRHEFSARIKGYVS